MKRRSNHARKLWKVTIKLPTPLLHGKTQRPVETDSEFTYNHVKAWSPGVAIARAMAKLRDEPQLKHLIIRDCFVAVKYLGVFTQEQEALENSPSEGPIEV